MSDPIASDTYTQIVQKLTKKYEHSCTSSLLLFKDRFGKWGVRFYAPYILKEFSDDHKIGADPTGILFYHDTLDMGEREEKKYKVFLNNTTNVKEKAIVVQFYDETPTQYFAQFVARFRRDEKPPSTFTGKGKWDHFDCALVAAYVRKTSTERKVIITMASVKKQLIINIPTSIPNDKAKFALKHWDHVLYTGTSVIKNGTKSYVDYNDDRIVLYQNFKETESANAVVLPTEGGQYGGISFKSPSSSALYAEWKDFDPKKLSDTERKEYELEALGYVDDDEVVQPSNEELQLSED